jgi:hypothetical protein
MLAAETLAVAIGRFTLTAAGAAVRSVSPPSIPEPDLQSPFPQNQALRDSAVIVQRIAAAACDERQMKNH